jgi:hypothetical protein
LIFFSFWDKNISDTLLSIQYTQKLRLAADTLQSFEITYLSRAYHHYGMKIFQVSYVEAEIGSWYSSIFRDYKNSFAHIILGTQFFFYSYLFEMKIYQVSYGQVSPLCYMNWQRVLQNASNFKIGVSINIIGHVFSVSICGVLIFCTKPWIYTRKSKLAHILCICGSIFTFLDNF